MRSISWKSLEKNVKLIASYIWNCNASKETIKGVNYDCVLKPKLGYWVIVEVTEQMKLEKVRMDIAKFASSRLSLISDGIFPECYLVMKDEPSNSMIETGKENMVNVLSYLSFSSLFINYESYFHVRAKKIFGSSVNPLSGKPDQLRYTPVFYKDHKTNANLDLNAIVKLINEGKRIILLGNYGTGKSRCIRELFMNLGSKQSATLKYPIAINLKDNWGTRKAEEIIRRHFDNVGLSDVADSILKIIDNEKLLLLLDGFDEIGSQAWSHDPQKLKQIRAAALSGTKDLIQKSKGAVIITGREHYFNNDNEMYSLLGLKQEDTILIKCKDEFTNEEMEDYLKSLSNIIDLPLWLPRRPIICQIINSLDVNDIEKIFVDSNSAVEFWKTLIYNLCVREARINPVLDSDTILKIFIKIGQMTRNKIGNVGPITVSEINKAFELVVGSSPVDDSAVMLQRLPALGRISAESNDRQFIDNYILDGLRAENLVQIINENLEKVKNEKWINPLDKLGIEIVSIYIRESHSANGFISYLFDNIDIDNKVLLGDIIASLTFYASKNPMDLGGITLSDSYISTLSLSNTLIDNFVIKDTIIEEIDITNYCCSRISFKDCIFKKVYGLESIEKAPSFISSNHIESCEKESISFYNNQMKLQPMQLIFISLIKKLFFLGSGSKSERELLSSYGNDDDKKLVLEVVKILHKEKVIKKSNSQKDVTYIAKSFNKPRMKNILTELNHSKDKLWLEIEKISSNNDQ